MYNFATQVTNGIFLEFSHQPGWLTESDIYFSPETRKIFKNLYQDYQKESHLKRCKIYQLWRNHICANGNDFVSLILGKFFEGLFCKRIWIYNWFLIRRWNIPWWNICGACTLQETLAVWCWWLHDASCGLTQRHPKNVFVILRSHAHGFLFHEISPNLGHFYPSN